MNNRREAKVGTVGAQCSTDTRSTIMLIFKIPQPRLTLVRVRNKRLGKCLPNGVHLTGVTAA
jgi:hypothetical protein